MPVGFKTKLLFKMRDYEAYKMYGDTGSGRVKKKKSLMLKDECVYQWSTQLYVQRYKIKIHVNTCDSLNVSWIPKGYRQHTFILNHSIPEPFSCKKKKHTREHFFFVMLNIEIVTHKGDPWSFSPSCCSRLGPWSTISCSNAAAILAGWKGVLTTSPRGCQRTTAWVLLPPPYYHNNHNYTHY